jgi:hypothetical protein
MYLTKVFIKDMIYHVYENKEIINQYNIKMVTNESLTQSYPL